MIVSKKSALVGFSFVASVKSFTIHSTRRSIYEIGLNQNNLIYRFNKSNALKHGTLSSSKAKSYKIGMGFFSNLFGSFTIPVIDYAALGHPGAEMGKYAEEKKVIVNSERDPELEAATFAGGCFWGLELAFQRVNGVNYTAVGYTQGKEDYPTYGQVSSGLTGHTEAVCVYYDSTVCDYSNLLDTFFSRVDPTTVNGQGSDFGKQYRTGVYYHTDLQREKAMLRFQAEREKYPRPLATELRGASLFWPAEKYHQQYLEKGGRFGLSQDASKGATEKIRCYG